MGLLRLLKNIFKNKIPLSPIRESINVPKPYLDEGDMDELGGVANS